MTLDETTEKAKSSLKQLLETLRISRVICVDDTYDKGLSIERAIVAAASLGAESLAGVIPELEGAYPADIDVRKAEIRRALSALDHPVFMERVRSIVAAAGDQDSQEADDIADAELLASLLPKDCLVPISPAEWHRDRSKLTTEVEVSRTLFLFDQDFSRSGGNSDDGIRIIASLTSEQGKERIICGLLTHTVTPDGLFEAWRSLADRYSVSMDKFLAIPKRYLSQDPSLFAQILKLVAISPDFALLKKSAKKLLAEAAAKAAEEVENVSIWDLDHIVFRVPSEEGNWEPDMLFRLYALFHRREARRLAFVSGELESIAQRLRAVSQIATIPIHNPPSNAWHLQHAELYETSEHIGASHLPIELGDIFVKTGSNSNKQYILLAQSCDLMVRPNGKRQPELVYVALAEIIQAIKEPSLSVPLTCFGKGPNERWWVCFKRIHYVHLCVLDLCVYNDKGNASMSFVDDVSSAIRPAWKARYQFLRHRFEKIRRRVEVLSPQEGEHAEVASIKTKLRSDLSRMFMDEGFFTGSLVNSNGSVSIVFNCQRVGRLQEPRSLGLLMSYTSLQSRPAYEPEFSQKAEN